MKNKKMIKQEQLIEAVKNIPIVAAKEQWVLTLDKEEGTLFIRQESFLTKLNSIKLQMSMQSILTINFNLRV